MLGIFVNCYDVCLNAMHCHELCVLLCCYWIFCKYVLHLWFCLFDALNMNWIDVTIRLGWCLAIVVDHMPWMLVNDCITQSVLIGFVAGSMGFPCMACFPVVDDGSLNVFLDYLLVLHTMHPAGIPCHALMNIAWWCVLAIVTCQLCIMHECLSWSVYVWYMWMVVCDCHFMFGVPAAGWMHCWFVWHFIWFEWWWALGHDNYGASMEMAWIVLKFWCLCFGPWMLMEPFWSLNSNIFVHGIGLM